jgi:hypothetical protein
MDQSSWKAQASAEIDQAEAARQAGNEGKARVCARRAAGHIIGEYFRRRGHPAPGPSAIVRLQSLAALPDISPQARAVAGHFLLRITPDHDLPVAADLLAEARWLAQELLGVSLG